MDASLLPASWSLQPPQFSDLKAVTALIAACDESDFGEADTTTDDLLAEWLRSGFDLPSNASLLIAADNSLAGYTDLKRTDFDPALMFVVGHEEEIAGVAACFDYPNYGWVRQLAVKNEYRGMGLGFSLLRHAFSEFFRCGKPYVGLVVDSQNPTGAPQLYLRAGMHPAVKIVTYKKWIDGRSAAC